MGTIFSRAMSHVHPIRSLKNASSSLKNVSRKALTKEWESGFIAKPKNIGQIGQDQLDNINDVFEGPHRRPQQRRDPETRARLFEDDGTTPLMDNPSSRFEQMNANDFNVGVHLKGNTLRHGKGSAHFRLTVSDEHGRSIKVKKDPTNAFLSDSIPATAKDSNGKRTSWIRSRKKSQPEPIHTGLENRAQAVYDEAAALDRAIDEAKTNRRLVSAEDREAGRHTDFLSLKILKKFGSQAYRDAVEGFIRNARALNRMEDTSVRLKSDGVFQIRTQLPSREFKVPFKKNPLAKQRFQKWDLKKRSDETWGDFIDRASRQAVQQERTLNNTRRYADD